MKLNQILDHLLGSPSRIRLLRELTLRPHSRSGRALGRDVGLSPPQVHAILQDLHHEGVVSLERVGRTYVYRLKRQVAPVAELLIPLFEKERDLVDAVTRQILAAVRTPLKSAYLFGSVSKKTDHAESDLDLAFVVKNKSLQEQAEDEFAGQVADVAQSLGVKLGPYVMTLSDMRRRYREKDPFVRDIFITGRHLAGATLFELVTHVAKKGQNAKA